MEVTGFPTSADIYLELNGKKVAVVQSYTAKASKTSRSVQAFGEREPIGTIAGQNKYTLELTRLYATDDAISDGINFYDLSDFSLVVCKPDRKIIYSGCQWSSISEQGELDAMVAEKITVVDKAGRTVPAHCRTAAEHLAGDGAGKKRDGSGLAVQRGGTGGKLLF